MEVIVAISARDVQGAPTFATYIIDILLDDRRTVSAQWLKEDHDFYFFQVARKVWVKTEAGSVEQVDEKVHVMVEVEYGEVYSRPFDSNEPLSPVAADWTYEYMINSSIYRRLQGKDDWHDYVQQETQSCRKQLEERLDWLKEKKDPAQLPSEPTSPSYIKRFFKEILASIGGLLKKLRIRIQEQVHIVSLGAGLQSSTMLLMAAHREIGPKPRWAIFSDTGWEPREVYQHLDWLKKEAGRFGIEVIRTSKGNIKEDLIRAAIDKSRSANPPMYLKNPDGSKAGLLPRGCTTEYKIDPIKRLTRQLLGYKPRERLNKHEVVRWLGISTDEIYRMKSSNESWEVLQYPLIEKGMNRLDCVNWMTNKGYPIPPKSSCIGCPYHSDDMWRHIKLTAPDEFQEAVEFEETIQKHGLRGLNGTPYLHPSRIPLSQLDFTSQLDLFNLLENEDAFQNECEGICEI